jgi:gliding motility-associated-like protein
MIRLIVLFFVLCSFSIGAQIPSATITAGTNTICTNSSVTFSSTVINNPDTYSWSVSPSTSVTIYPNTGSAGISISFGRAGTHTVSLLVSNASGSNIATRVVTVTQSANASFNAQMSNSGYPSNLTLTNFSSNYYKNYWIFSHIPGIAGLDSTNHTSMTYTTSGSYTVTLVAHGNNGCNDTSSYRFYINDSSGVTAPTIFTPNNDNVNDLFKPIARGISQMNVWIYNRYGTLVAQWDKVNGFWDGYTTSGQPCAAGVYFYIIEATGFDGRSYKIKNNLTLIR